MSFRAQKELEEARKAGKVPAEVDEDGLEINPHIPNFIQKAPWYIDRGVPSLKHQRLEQQQQQQVATGFAGFTRNLVRSSNASNRASKRFRKGACENCGSMGHQAKACLERPRKISAKVSGNVTGHDEYLEENIVGFDAKRDRWNTYDPDDYASVVENHQFLEEEAKRQQAEMAAQEKAEKEHRLEEDLLKDPSQLPLADLLDDEDEDEDEDETGKKNEEDGDESCDIPGQKFDMKSRMTVRNLRLREDTAKYLNDLDPDSTAHYDPKSRSLRQAEDVAACEDQAQDSDFTLPKLQRNDLKGTERDQFCWDDLHRAKIVMQEQSLRLPGKAVAQSASSTDKVVQPSQELIDEYGPQPVLEHSFGDLL